MDDRGGRARASDESAAFFPGAISADSHVLEPPDCYERFIEPRFRELAPRVVRREGHPDAFAIPGMPGLVALANLVSAGMTASERRARSASLRFEETRPSAWDARQRAADQARDGVAAEVLYPSVGLALCDHPDLAYRAACMQAYNRWLESYCGQAAGRVFGLGMCAVASVDHALREFEAAKTMGMVGILMPGSPGHADYDHADYDALWECAASLGLPLCFHVFGSRDRGRPRPVRGHRLNAWAATLRAVQDVAGMLVLAGVFERHPKLNVVCAEADAGWMPHYMQRLDHAAHRHADDGILPGLAKLPSEYLRSNVWLTFQDDAVAFATRGLMNPLRLLWANDFPHSDSTWPNSQALVRQHAAGVPPGELRAILRDNARGLFRLPLG
jgi:predicted TIM-barrel fold metal-dependent hydrolase